MIKYTRTSNCRSLAVGNWELKLWQHQRSAGRHIIGPVFISTEVLPKAEWGRWFNLTVGDPKVHRRWAFNAYLHHYSKRS